MGAPRYGASALNQTFEYAVKLVQERTALDRPWVVFRETAATHFDTPGGLWPGQGFPLTLESPCARRSLEEMVRIGNWRNQQVEVLLRAARAREARNCEPWSVLRVFEASAQQPHLHTGRDHGTRYGLRFIELPNGTYDCTHWSLPSPVVDRWSYVLFKALLSECDPA